MHFFRLLALLTLPFLGFSQTPPKDSFVNIKLVFAGDIMGHDSQIKAASREGGKYYDYTGCFQFVKPIIENADLAVANLELTLPGRPPYTGYPCFKSPDELALALRDAGFDLLVTANNHSNDAGPSGVLQTINTLSDYNFFQTGTFRNEQERDFYYPLIIYRNNFKLAFLNYTYGTNGIPTKPPVVVNLIDESIIKKDLEITRQLKPDAIFVIMHWGDEYQLIENAKQRELAGKLLEWGADFVIGAHPHVVQPIVEKKFTTGGKNKTGLVAYSLGNFISNQQRLHTDGGIMLELDLKKNIYSGTTSMSSHGYIPVWRYVHREPSGNITFTILPVSEFEEPEKAPLPLPLQDQQKMMRFAKNVRDHLEKFGASERFPLNEAAK